MEYKIVLIVLVLGAAIFSGCVEDKTVYYNQEFNETITLYADNTVTILGGGEYGHTGVYRVDKGHIIMTFPPFGTTLDFKKEGNNLVRVSDGKVWVRV